MGTVGFKAYMGMLMMDHKHNNPILLALTDMFIRGTYFPFIYSLTYIVRSPNCLYPTRNERVAKRKEVSDLEKSGGKMGRE